MEGETGVMKQLQSQWHILKLIDQGMFSHLSQIGAESLHFAFRMLQVLFWRELSFNEALCMWEGGRDWMTGLVRCLRSEDMLLDSENFDICDAFDRLSNLSAGEVRATESQY